MRKKAIYPGTFDPITNGHLSIIERAAKLFDEVVVAVAQSTSKGPTFSSEQRVQLIEKTTKMFSNVYVTQFSNLLIDFAASEQANIIVRGLRAVSDFEYEFQLAAMNRQLNNEIETVFLMPPEQHTFVSSTLVREIALLGGDITSFVPTCVVEALKVVNK